ncbi:Tom20 family protein NDAI_0A04910 [Naumovozyma dairenensis CBS 421]|uniref:Mitochondrial import receptor subunit TOM20 n=1 Tax=Naumovozyma dairenensis (strain ATCC 10597 / BCRC 20456 / CBS 421 / NBRC 0211 / NRRL Y-12639) TaxID=1071378 RepID=G0W4A8_NAUDC|nr:hypothetical protein NDAI_0A04910 [Naumovozyma dairenensis CBS 421]CCD22646.1 hypothetical protein NDAI_0A04910 [Naumovozyma dairenensis CBS 421]
MPSTSSIIKTATITTSVVIASIGCYAVYFDYQRRKNPHFRKELRKKLKKEAKELEISKKKAEEEFLAKIREFLTQDLLNDPISMDPEKREEIFASNVEMGERLTIQPGQEIESASKFYRALCVYPKPTDLLKIYQRTIPENIYEIVQMMLTVVPPDNLMDFLKNSFDRYMRGVDPLVGLGSEVDVESDLANTNDDDVDHDIHEL